MSIVLRGGRHLLRGGVGGHQARRIDRTPASRVHSEHHSETAGKNAEAPPAAGAQQVSGIPDWSALRQCVRSINRSNLIGGSWLTHWGLSVGGVASNERVQVLVDERDGHRAFADRGCDALDRAVAYVAGDEETWLARLEVEWRAVEWP